MFNRPQLIVIGLMVGSVVFSCLGLAGFFVWTFYHGDPCGSELEAQFAIVQVGDSMDKVIEVMGREPNDSGVDANGVTYWNYHCDVLSWHYNLHFDANDRVAKKFVYDF